VIDQSPHESWADSTMAEGNESGSTLRILQSGEILFEEGDVGNVAFVVESGTIQICRFNGERVVILAELERSCLFGEMALIDEQPRSATARASGETLVRQIGKKEFLQHLRSSPGATFKMMQQLVAIIRNLNDKICLDTWQASEVPEQTDVD
jgi:CRP-like cAMP-binding protein